MIQNALGYEELVSSMTAKRKQASRVVGSLLLGVPSIEIQVLKLACSRLGYEHVELGWDDALSKSDEDLTTELSMLNSVVDLIVTGFIDRETLGSGRALIEQFAQTSSAPMISLADEIYASQAALGVAASFWERLGGLRGKRIAVCWGFGSKFVLPNTAHSLLLILASLGADVILASPPDFPLLGRVIRDAERRARQSGSHFEETIDIQEALQVVDAVFAANWCRFDDLHHPERNADRASKFRNWFFTDERLPPNCFFLSEPPIQTDLLLDTELEKSDRNLTKGLILKRIQILTASIKHVENGFLREGSSALT
jgi:hypothetical protein